MTLKLIVPMMKDPRLLAEVAAHPFPLLFATVSGAHLYGFPSPDSDYDLRGAHVALASVFEGVAAAGQAVALRFSSSPFRCAHDANWRGECESP